MVPSVQGGGCEPQSTENGALHSCWWRCGLRLIKSIVSPCTKVGFKDLRSTALCPGLEGGQSSQQAWPSPARGSSGRPACFPSARVEERLFNINSYSLPFSRVHIFLTSEQKNRKHEFQGRNYPGLIFPFCWPLPPSLRVKCVEGRTARLSVCAWWEQLNYRGMFSTPPHTRARAARLPGLAGSQARGAGAGAGGAEDRGNPRRAASWSQGAGAASLLCHEKVSGFFMKSLRYTCQASSIRLNYSL